MASAWRYASARSVAEEDRSTQVIVANPSSGDVSIINIASQRMMGQAQVGRGPCHIAITPDHQFACVLNRESGDMVRGHEGAVIW